MSDATNELLTHWYLIRDLPDFSALRPEHFPPAFELAMRAHLEEIDAVTSNPENPSFANTIEALERAGLRLSRTSAAFWNIASADTNPDIQALERELAPKMSAHATKVTSNQALFERLSAIWDMRYQLSLSDEQARVLKRTYDGFERAGARLKGTERERLGVIKQRLAELGTSFGQNVLADEASFMLEIHDDADLAGLPESLRQAMASAASERDTDAPYVVTLSRSLIDPFLTFSTRRELREKAFQGWTLRGQNGDASDNRSIIAETLALRHELANLLDFATYADFKLDNTMAKTQAEVKSLLETVWPHAKRQAAIERDMLADAAKAAGTNLKLEPWDWRYWAERVRQSNYDLDENEVKQYLALDNVIAAAFDVANRLFGLSFNERPDIKTYHEDVRAFDVTDRSGQPVGLFLADYYARPSKRSGAWMTGFRSQERLRAETRPIILNVMNFAKPKPGTPALLSFDDARTLFHEFGHGLHGLLSDVTYPSLSGTSVERDFVELPSQLYEHWLEQPELLRRFAIHHETGAPIPDALIEKIEAAGTFNQGFATVEYLASALVDMAYHGPEYQIGRDPIEFEAETLANLGLPAEITMRHRSPHFLHIFAGDGYSAGYYSYMWSEVLDADAFAAFQETGDIFDSSTAEKLLRHIYSAGGKKTGSEAYKSFRGKLPTVDGLLKQRGLIEAGVA
ncbi:MAG: peptidyl-dipeptidase Dcp [Alphaproteobacteria bacterium]|jgi:peptidyl-dipeptidase Dcp